MNKSRAMLFSAVLLTVAFVGTAMAGTSVSFMAAGHTTEQSAVHASFLASVPNMDDPSMGITSAISVSNILAAPAGVDAAGGAYEGYNKMGTVEIYLYNQDGTMAMYSTDKMTAGSGTDKDGNLMPGGTYTVFLHELLAAAGHEGMFIGYAWIVGNFDGIAGTRTVMGMGFNQHGDLSPGVNHMGGGVKPMMMSDDDMDHDH